MHGKEFENIIFNNLNKISQKKLGFFIKSPTPMKSIKIGSTYKVIYHQKALCDFVGIINGQFILIEAKEISNTRFEFRRLKYHQIEQLLSIKKHGGTSIIIFYIKLKNMILLVDIDAYLEHFNNSKKKSINIDALTKLGKLIDLNLFNDDFLFQSILSKDFFNF